MRMQSHFVPETRSFGAAEPGIDYTNRRAAYIVVVTEQGSVAAVKGREKYFLPGGGSLPGESPEETVHREVREELARDIRLAEQIGEVTQYFHAASDDCYYRMQAVFFTAELTDTLPGSPEHELVWLPLAQAERLFFHLSHSWAALCPKL